jgi:hypothetical protein
MLLQYEHPRASLFDHHLAFEYFTSYVFGMFSMFSIFDMFNMYMTASVVVLRANQGAGVCVE